MYDFVLTNKLAHQAGQNFISLPRKGAEQAQHLNRKPKTQKEEGYNETIFLVLNLRPGRFNFDGVARSRLKPGR